MNDQLDIERNDESVEQMIQRKNLSAARVTPADVEAAIATEVYFTGADGAASQYDRPLAGAWSRNLTPSALSSLGLLTFCVLVLKNGFTVTGESACASPANFDPEVGRKVARANAVSKIWPLLGYELKTKLAG